jgi:hypothetical protein
MLRARFCLQWLPVRGAAAVSAAHGAKRFITLNISLGMLWVPRHFHRAKFIISPQRSQTPADRAIALGCLGNPPVFKLT